MIVMRADQTDSIHSGENMNRTSRQVGPGTFTVVTLLLLCASVVWAQTDTARLQGTVSDPTGGVVPGATVKVRNLAAGRVVSASTNGDGSFGFSALRRNL